MSHCAVLSCKTSVFNIGPGVSLHPCPTSLEMRNKWLQLLRNKCPVLDWSNSKICSKHFENKCFDSQLRLKDSAIPTLFPVASQPAKTSMKNEPLIMRSKIDGHLSKMTQAQLMVDIKNNIKKLREPANLHEFVTPGLQSQTDAPMEAKLWLLIKKQEHLNNKLMEVVIRNKNSTECVKKSLDEVNTSKKELEKSVETYKYIVKCLQEKQATLEEQVEILSAVESR